MKNAEALGVISVVLSGYSLICVSVALAGQIRLSASASVTWFRKVSTFVVFSGEFMIAMQD